jgi:hypothetical protein
VPVPGVNRAALEQFFAGNPIFGLLDLFSGGGLSNFSVIGLGVNPYINASIIMQLMTGVIPALVALSREGEYGRNRINQYTRYLAVPLAMLQAYGFLALLNSQNILTSGFRLASLETITQIITLTAGSILLMWLGAPKKGRSHTLRIIRELLEFQPKNQKTNISEALRYLTNAIKKKCIAFVVSDFLDYENETKLNFEDALKIANRKHDVVALQIRDKRETMLPPVGLIKFKDAETNKEIWIDTSDKTLREKYSAWWYGFQENLNSTLSRCKVDHALLNTGEDYVKPLMQMFELR